jgi:long-chain fatty acid transport protein
MTGKFRFSGGFMKKVLCTLLILGLFLPAAAFAGSLDYLTNQSARWLMTPTRNAATDAADIVNYNPAGTVFLPLGWNIDVSNQTLFKWYGNDTAVTSGPGWNSTLSLPPLSSNDTLKQDLPTWYLPNLYVVYNSGKVAIYGQAGITAGGGNLKYDNGTAGSTFALTGLRAAVRSGQIAASIPALAGAFPAGTDLGDITSQEFEAASVYYGIGFGVASTVVDDTLSVSVGGRFLIPQRGFRLEAAYGANPLGAEFEYTAFGFTPIIGIDVRPVGDLTLSFRYECETSLNFEYKEKEMIGSPAYAGLAKGFLTGQGIYDGKRFNQNLPHSFFLGAEYNVTRDLTVSLSGNIYLLSIADLGETSAGKQINDHFGTGYEIGLGAIYKLTEEFKMGAGIFYTETGAKDSYFNNSATLLNASANPTLDSIAFGLGGTYSFKNGLDLTVSGLYCHYLPVDYSVSQPGVYTVSGEFTKEVLEIGIGVGYHY